GDLLQVQRFEKAGDDAGQASGGEVGVRIQRAAVRAEWEVRDDAAELTLEQRRDLAPEPPVHEQSVDEDDRRAVARLGVLDGSLRELRLTHAGLLRLWICVRMNLGQALGLRATALSSGAAWRYATRSIALPSRSLIRSQVWRVNACF